MVPTRVNILIDTAGWVYAGPPGKAAGLRRFSRGQPLPHRAGSNLRQNHPLGPVMGGHAAGTPPAESNFKSSIKSSFRLLLP